MFIYLKNTGFLCSKHSQTRLSLPSKRYVPLLRDEINIALWRVGDTGTQCGEDNKMKDSVPLPHRITPVNMSLVPPLEILLSKNIIILIKLGNLLRISLLFEILSHMT